jgi:hypothetical protein
MITASGGEMSLFIGGPSDGVRLLLNELRPVIELVDGKERPRYRRWMLKLDGEQFVVYLFDGLNRAEGFRKLLRHYFVKR